MREGAEKVLFVQSQWAVDGGKAVNNAFKTMIKSSRLNFSRQVRGGEYRRHVL